MEATREYLEKVHAELHEKKKYIDVVVDEGGYLPSRSHPGDAGGDLYAPDKIVIWPHSVEIVKIKIHVPIPDGYAGIIVPRSSVSAMGIVIQGVIDAGYTGEYGVIMHNITNDRITFEKGHRIAQLVIPQIITPKFRQVEMLEVSERGNGGFGSTGR